jgi:hypothetical protein
LTVRDDVDAFRRVLGENNVPGLAREKFSHRSAGAFVVLGRLLGQAMRAPSVVACVGEEVLVYRLNRGLWRLARGSVIEINDVI